MKLICEKHKEEMESEGAICRHPGEYCKFRTSCIINFMGGENQLDVTDAAASATEEHEQKTEEL